MLRRDVSCTLGFNFHAPSTLALQVAVARDGLMTERVDAWAGGTVGITATGSPIGVVEAAGPHGGRVHIVQASAGPVTFTYAATTSPPEARAPQPSPDPYAYEVLAALHQSRYCPSDLMGAFARTELLGLSADDPVTVANAAASWVFERIAYVPGASGPADTALDTLMAGRGICRDFAHLTIAMCRAMRVSARLVAAYAPGLAPMDFHAVVEFWTGDRWAIIDPTRLAPRSSLVRVATGRDAADTALTATVAGDVELVTCEVLAVADGNLPADDHVSLHVLA
jgi:transglutaminase-like putative cysteine protease